MMEVADIFRTFGPGYRKMHQLPYHIHKVMNAIESCRTAKLGGHKDQCDTCGHIRISYNSCRNRHCPKCQGLAREKWLNARKKDLLPVEYYHLVFTLPQELNSIILRNQKELYTILFQSSSETLLELAKDSKYIGADIGFISILHTWGQNLMDHPHVHSIVTGGGLSKGNGWIASRKKFFLPVKVIARLFRGKYLAYLKTLYSQKKLKFPGEINSLEKPQNFSNLLKTLYGKEWVCYCKPPFSNAEQVLEYMGRYTHRVAIANNRLEKVQDGKVTFRWRDYKDNNKNKSMTLEAHEFIRRFLLHILPDKFVKIRHYGILSNRNRKTKLKKCKNLLNGTGEIEAKEIIEESLQGDKRIDYKKCPCCDKGVMIAKAMLQPEKHGPPKKVRLIA